MLVGFIESYVQANQTITQIEGLLGRVCRLTPFASQCVQFVDTYTPIMVQYIQANEGTEHQRSDLYKIYRRDLIMTPNSFYADPQTVCQQIGVCSSQAARTNEAMLVKFN
jgi:hypothetical protein